MLLRIAEAMDARIEELARLIALGTGNALRTQARAEARLSADIFRYFGGLAGELRAKRSRWASMSSATRDASRWVSSARSFRGTRRCCWAR